MRDVRSLVDQLNADKDTQGAETLRFTEEQKIKKALGPSLWDDLKTEIKSSCEAIAKSSPVSLKAEEDGVNVLSVVNLRDGRRAVLTYNPEVPCVFYQTPRGKGRAMFRVSADGNQLQLLVNDIPQFVGEIAVTILSQVCG